MIKIAKFEEFLRDKGYSDDKEGHVNNLLLSCNTQDFQKKTEIFNISLESWFEKSIIGHVLDPPLGIFVELRLYNFIKDIDPTFIPEERIETADIEIEDIDFSFQIECTHATLETIQDFYRKTTVVVDSLLNEKEISKKMDLAIGLENPSFLHWRILENISRKAYKNIQKPFIEYFWYPPVCRLDDTDFSDLINFPYHKTATFNRDEWKKLDNLLLKLKTENVLENYKYATRDLDEKTRSDFYSIIEDNAKFQLEAYHNTRNIGVNIDIYRNTLNLEQMKEIIVNTIIFRYKIQTSANFLGLITDNSKLEEKPRLFFVPFEKNIDKFEKAKKTIKTAII